MNTCTACGLPIDRDDLVPWHDPGCRRDDEEGCSCNRLAHRACVDHGAARDGS